MLWGRGHHPFAQIDRSKAPEPGPAPELNIGTSTEVKLANGMTLIVVETTTPSVYWSMTLEFQPFRGRQGRHDGRGQRHDVQRH